MVKDKITKILINNIKEIILIVIFILMYGVLFAYFSYKINKKELIENKSDEVYLLAEKENIIDNEITVDIKGSVKNPGVYTLKENSRTNDAINMAGGLNKNANTRFINLSKKLNDGDVIVIYSNDEIKKAQKTETIIVETPCVCEEVKNDSCYKDSQSDNVSKININTASLAQLTSLDGIGDAKAKSIIEYRTQNGSFKNIKDILNVKGISETIYSKIKEIITV